MSPTYSVCRDHGYLTGEQYTCPICGQKTEVYSRITGYYRPVQNWNDGKAQEYKDRKVYNIGRSHLTHIGPNPAPVDEDEIVAAFEEAPQEGVDDVKVMKRKTTGVKLVQPAYDAAANAKAVQEAGAEPLEREKMSAASQTEPSILLFKTPTCPNCKAAGALLDKAGIAYQALNANEEKELVEKFGVKQAPTLVLINEEGFEKFRGVSDIKGWLMSRQ